MARPVLLVVNRRKPRVLEALDAVREVINKYSSIAMEIEANGAPVPDTKNAELIMVLGGDGTLLAQARRFAHTGLPLVGVNLGHLGYLTGFDLDTLGVHAKAMLTSKKLETHQRMLMRAEIEARGGKTVFSGAAMNDVVITAGPPYRMIEIGLRIADTDVRVIRGDGVVVATPIGSTAYNVSAGGPIVSPELEAMIVTAIAAHSLSFRPIVVEAASGIELSVLRAQPRQGMRAGRLGGRRSRRHHARSRRAGDAPHHRGRHGLAPAAPAERSPGQGPRRRLLGHPRRQDALGGPARGFPYLLTDA